MNEYRITMTNGAVFFTGGWDHIGFLLSAIKNEWDKAIQKHNPDYELGIMASVIMDGPEQMVILNPFTIVSIVDLRPDNEVVYEEHT